MSMVTAVKYLAVTAADYLMPWEPSREKAAQMLAELPLMRKLRAEDDATADEVTYLVLGRFEAEPPSVEGADWLADGVAGLKEMADAAAAWLDKPQSADAAVLVAEAVAVLNEPKAEEPPPQQHLYVFGKHDIPWCPACKRESEQSSAHGYTTDGHPCCGLATVGDRPNRRARCGGVTLCRRCSSDASRIHGAQAVPFGPVSADGEAKS